MSSVESKELEDALSFYFGLPVWAPRTLEGASIYSTSPCQVHLSSFIIRITLVLSDFDSDASSVVFARRVNYYYYSSKYAEVVIFVTFVGWSPKYHSSLESGRKILHHWNKKWWPYMSEFEVMVEKVIFGAKSN